MSKDNLKMHKLITYLYLPLSTALNIYLALGNVYDIGRMNFTSILSIFEAVDLFLPFLTVLLYTVSLIGLLGKTRAGWKMILLSTTIRIYIMFILIIGNILLNKYLFALHFVALSSIAYLIHNYYKKRESFFS